MEEPLTWVPADRCIDKVQTSLPEEYPGKAQTSKAEVLLDGKEMMYRGNRIS